MPFSEINWTIYIEEDFLENGFTDNQIIKAKKKVETAALFPSRMKKVEGFPKGYDVRRVRHMHYRIFLLLNWVSEKIDCLKMFADHKGYKLKQQNKILTVIQKISNN